MSIKVSPVHFHHTDMLLITVQVFMFSSVVPGQNYAIHTISCVFSITRAFLKRYEVNVCVIWALSRELLYNDQRVRAEYELMSTEGAVVRTHSVSQFSSYFLHGETFSLDSYDERGHLMASLWNRRVAVTIRWVSDHRLHEDLLSSWQPITLIHATVYLNRKSDLGETPRMRCILISVGFI